MKVVEIDVIPDLPGLVAMSVYETKTVHFLLMCCNSVKCVNKNSRCITPNQRWYVTINFCIGM